MSFPLSSLSVTVPEVAGPVIVMVAGAALSTIFGPADDDDHDEPELPGGTGHDDELDELELDFLDDLDELDELEEPGMNHHSFLCPPPITIPL